MEPFDRQAARRLQETIAENRKILAEARTERFSRLGCRLWATALTTACALWIVAILLQSSPLGAVGAILLVPVVVGLIMHVANDPDQVDTCRHCGGRL